MAKQYLIIDGYNLMHAAGFARLRYGPGDLERQRNRFLKSLSTQLTESERKLTSIIFDAFDSPSNHARVTYLDEIKVEFANAGEDADSLIEEKILEHSSAKQILMVSSDHRLQKAIKRRKGSSIDSDQYWNRLSSRAEADKSAERIDKSNLSEKMDPKSLDQLQNEIDQIIEEE